MIKRKPKTALRQYDFKELLVTYASDDLVVTMRRLADDKYELVQMTNEDGILALHCSCGKEECSSTVICSSVEETLAAAEEMIASTPDMEQLVEDLQTQKKETLH